MAFSIGSGGGGEGGECGVVGFELGEVACEGVEVFIGDGEEDSEF